MRCGFRRAEALRFHQETRPFDGEIGMGLRQKTGGFHGKIGIGLRQEISIGLRREGCLFGNLLAS
jgi:hypothetical protein